MLGFIFLVSPFQGDGHFSDPIPRALPWALLLPPFRRSAPESGALAESNLRTRRLSLTPPGGYRAMHNSMRVLFFAGIAASALIVGSMVVTDSAGAAELRAGTARVDLTPPLELKSSLGGYGERMNRPAEGVHDRVFAKALALSDGTRKFTVVTVDIVAFPPALKPALVERLADSGLTNDQLLLLPSHSHTSIEMNAINPANTFDIPQMGIHNPKVYEFLIGWLAQLVRDAGNRLVPVQIGTSVTQISGWNRNRRKTPALDQNLTVSRIDKLDGSPLAVFVNFTAHPTFMSSKDMLFSGDWPGHLQRTLESLIGDNVVAMYSNGAEGDQSVLARPDSGDSRWEKA